MGSNSKEIRSLSFEEAIVGKKIASVAHIQGKAFEFTLDDGSVFGTYPLEGMVVVTYKPKGTVENEASHN